jgi:hypothetical protein
MGLCACAKAPAHAISAGNPYTYLGFFCLQELCACTGNPYLVFVLFT